MALDLGLKKYRRPPGKPTILQLCAFEAPFRNGLICLALCRTDNGTEVFGVDGKGKLAILEDE